MFYYKVTVPRINAEQIAKLEAVLPGLATVAKLPVITTKEQAYRAAVNFAHKNLATSEYVKQAVETTETDTGWVFNLEIWGD